MSAESRFLKNSMHMGGLLYLTYQGKIFLFDFFLKPDITVPNITYLLKMLA